MHWLKNKNLALRHDSVFKTHHVVVFTDHLITVTTDNQMLCSKYLSVVKNKDINILLGLSRSILNCNLF